MVEAVKLLLLAVFGLLLNLTIISIGLPVRWMYRRYVNVCLICTTLREWYVYFFQCQYLSAHDHLYTYTQYSSRLTYDD